MTQINRFKGSWPKVGIRPTIDGRMKGVRESLEQQTMSMAESVSQLISSTLRYPDGSPVECIISDTTIGRVAESVMRGKSYLSIGAVCMGIAGSIVNTDFFEDYLGMRCEGIDEVEIIRRMTEGIYDKEEFAKALAWAILLTSVHTGVPNQSNALPGKTIRAC